jgi:hypothetical protein
MLFDSIVAQVVGKTFSDAVAKANQERKAEALRRLEYYLDGQLEYLQTQLDKVFADSSKILPVFINVTKKIINNTARVYAYPPKREVVNGTTRDAEIFTEMLGTTALPRKLKTASRYCKLLKTILLRPVWRDGKMDIDILTPDILDVLYGDTPEQLLAVLITLYPQSGKTDEITYSYWTPEEYKKLDYMGNAIEAQPNPYGLLPFIPCWDRVPTSEFWIQSGDDLSNIQDAINLRLTDLCYVLQQEGYGQPVLTGMDQTKGQSDMYVGVGRIMVLPKDANFTFQSTNAPIDQILASIKFLISQAAISNGLSAHLLVDEPSEQSGISKIVSNEEMAEARADDIDLWRDYEHSLFNVMKAVWNYHEPGRKISDAAVLKIDFADPLPEVNPVDQANTWKILYDMTVISQVDIVMAQNPDITSREDALAFLLQVEQERNTLGSRTL